MRAGAIWLYFCHHFAEIIMLFKAAIIIVLVLILLSLATALFSMLKGNQDSMRTVKALTIRIALSIGLLIFIMIGYSLGLISPHGLL